MCQWLRKKLDLVPPNLIETNRSIILWLKLWNITKEKMLQYMKDILRIVKVTIINNKLSLVSDKLSLL